MNMTASIQQDKKGVYVITYKCSDTLGISGTARIAAQSRVAAKVKFIHHMEESGYKVQFKQDSILGNCDY